MELADRCNQIGINAEPAIIIADFEQAVSRGTETFSDRKFARKVVFLKVHGEKYKI